MLDQHAVRSLQRLQSRGYEAYLVGGCVRDLLLGRFPKDFDIATEARPQQVKRTFPRNCRIIGRRFKLAHLHFEQNQKILEVATFRTLPSADQSGDAEDLLITRDNQFGTAEEDALRRDFTVNALFFDPIADCIIDYCDGLDDLRQRLLRTIGDPIVRFREDPVRIVRAAKFAARLDFRIESSSYEAMAEVAGDLARAAPPRMLEEILKLLRGGHSLGAFQILRDIGALRVILPVVADFLTEAPEQDRVRFWRTLEALDHQVLSDAAPPSPVLLGTLFESAVRLQQQRQPRRSATTVAEALIGPFALELRLARRDAGCLKRICGVQPRFTGEGPRRFKTSAFLRDPYFDEALALFELTCAATGEGQEQLALWRERKAKETGAGSEFDDLEMDLADPADDAADAEVAETAGGADDEAEASDDDRDARPARRRRRRRRRGRGGSRADGAEADGEPSADNGHAAADVEDEVHDANEAATAAPEAEAPDDVDAEAAPEARDCEAGDDPAEAERGPRKAKRRRRRRRGKGGGAAEGADTTDRAAAPRQSEASGEGRGKRRGERERERERSSRRGGKKRQEAQARSKTKQTKKATPSKRKSRRSGRETKIEVIEPEPIDLSAFDVELGPRQVPTFGVIIDDEGGPAKKSKKRRTQRMPPSEEDDYRPPPPPTQPDPAPPPPQPSDDEFGDW
ncbi:MAG: polynucleotide adenylyltransferase PcnB [Planctomycetota bacterium]